MADIALHDTCIAGSWGIGLLLLPVVVVVLILGAAALIKSTVR